MQPAFAEVFKCKDKNGQTVFAHVPCAAKKAPDPAIAQRKQQQDNSQRLREIDAQLNLLQATITMLQEYQDQELITAEQSESDEQSLYERQKIIRNRIGTQINDELAKMSKLRKERSDLLRLENR